MIQNKSNLPGSHSKNGIEWIEETIPKSRKFDDTYYSKSDGLAETRHNFIRGNDLPRRWPNMQHCTIGELGFGTGLNFLATVTDWQKHKPPNGTLHFISFEQYPIEAGAMRRALSRWPELGEPADILLSQWQPQYEFIDTGFEGKLADIRLTVFFSDANSRLPQLELLADAWFLDGFSPAKNPELWNETLLHHVYSKTAKGGTFATYTSAGFVRRNLEAAGFNVSKVSGHAGKREMSIGFKPA